MLLAPKQIDQSPASHPYEYAGELEMFTCPNHTGNLRLTKTGCIGMYLRSQRANLEQDVEIRPCRECPIGEQHSGIKSRPPTPVFCIRCEVHSLRLIGRLLCPSCSNRQVEYVIGSNARGAFPVNYKPLRIYDHDDSLIIVARNIKEAERVAKRMHGYCELEALNDYGLATPDEISTWWQHVKIWSEKHRSPRADFKL